MIIRVHEAVALHVCEAGRRSPVWCVLSALGVRAAPFGCRVAREWWCGRAAREWAWRSWRCGVRLVSGRVVWCPPCPLLLNMPTGFGKKKEL